MKVLILSASGTAQELRELVSISESLEFCGFLDDFKQGDDIAGKVSEWQDWNSSEYRFLSALGSYRSMERRKEILDSIPLAHFTEFVHSSCIVYPSASVATSTVLFPLTVLSSNVSMGNHCLIYHSCVISHDSQIGSYSVIANNATISGNVGIGNNCYIGASATLKEGITVGNDSIVAAGATVTKNVPERSIYINKDKILSNHYYSGN